MVSVWHASANTKDLLRTSPWIMFSFFHKSSCCTFIKRITAYNLKTKMLHNLVGEGAMNIQCNMQFCKQHHTFRVLSQKAKVPVDNALQNGQMYCFWTLVWTCDTPTQVGWYLPYHMTKIKVVSLLTNHSNHSNIVASRAESIGTRT